MPKFCGQKEGWERRNSGVEEERNIIFYAQALYNKASQTRTLNVFRVCTWLDVSILGIGRWAQKWLQGVSDTFHLLNLTVLHLSKTEDLAIRWTDLQEVSINKNPHGAIFHSRKTNHWLLNPFFLLHPMPYINSLIICWAREDTKPRSNKGPSFILTWGQSSHVNFFSCPKIFPS